MTYKLSGTNGLNVSSLDFEEIRNNLATFLNQQPDLADIDFTSSGSAASMILNILATATAYNGVYAQFSYTNSWPASANFEDAVLGCASLASVLVPYKQSAYANYTLIVGENDQTGATGSVPAYTAFDAVGTDGSQLYFYNIETIPFNVSSSVTLYSGSAVETFTNYDYTTQSITLPKDIDPATITMVVNTSGTNTTWTRVEKGRDVSGTNQNVFCVTHSVDGYRVTNALPSATQLTTSSRVAVTAIYSNGSSGNEATISLPIEFTASYYSDAANGYDALSTEQLKAKFNFNFTGYQRCVTLEDYKNAIVASGISGTEDINNVTVANSSIPCTVKIYVTGLSSGNQTILMNYLSNLAMAGINLTYSL